MFWTGTRCNLQRDSIVKVPGTDVKTPKPEKNGEVHQRKGHEGPEGEWRCSCTPSLTSARKRKIM